jgi:hypothetical protein
MGWSRCGVTGYQESKYSESTCAGSHLYGKRLPGSDQRQRLLRSL